MMMNGIEAVIFDLDGSLVDSMWIWKDIDIDYLGRFGLVPPPDLSGKLRGRVFRKQLLTSRSVSACRTLWSRLRRTGTGWLGTNI